MSSEMIGEEPAVTEDSDLSSIIRELYAGRIGRIHALADFCVGGALCHHFLKDEADWKIIKRQAFPFPDQLAYDLDWIVRDRASEDVQQHYFGDPYSEAWTKDPYHYKWDAGDVEDRDDELEHTLRYYANAMINANDAGDYDDAWVHVDMFLKEFEID